jgi:hypothetical protein
MSKFVEDCKIKLDDWISSGHPEILSNGPLMQLAWNYFLTTIHNKKKVNDQIIKVNNIITKYVEKVLVLKNNINAFFGQSMSYVPMLADPNTMKYIIPRTDLPTDRNFLYENFYGKEQKLNLQNIDKAWNDFSIPFITASLLAIKLMEYDKNFNEKDVYEIINNELEDSYKFAKLLLNKK